MWWRHHGNVPTGVIDVGSNTVRLHVAHDGETVFGERALFGLGEAVERDGAIPEPKLDEVAACVAGYVKQAREHGAISVEVLVTSPGRQAANGDELVRRLEQATEVPVRLLSAVDEARLGFAGGVAATRISPGRIVAVVDVGGGSAQIAVGTRRDGPAWVRSVDIGSMRLTSRCVVNDPLGPDESSAMRAEVARYLDDIAPPQPRVALAVAAAPGTCEGLPDHRGWARTSSRPRSTCSSQFRPKRLCADSTSLRSDFSLSSQAQLILEGDPGAPGHGLSRRPRWYPRRRNTRARESPRRRVGCCSFVMGVRATAWPGRAPTASDRSTSEDFVRQKRSSSF